MIYYVVNKNSLDEIVKVNSESETAFYIWDNKGIKYSLFGPTVFCFQTKQRATQFAHSILDEDILLTEHRLGKLKGKKNKLKKDK